MWTWSAVVLPIRTIALVTFPRESHLNTLPSTRGSWETSFARSGWPQAVHPDARAGTLDSRKPADREIVGIGPVVDGMRVGAGRVRAELLDERRRSGQFPLNFRNGRGEGLER